VENLPYPTPTCSSRAPGAPCPARTRELAARAARCVRCLGRAAAGVANAGQRLSLGRKHLPRLQGACAAQVLQESGNRGALPLDARTLQLRPRQCAPLPLQPSHHLKVLTSMRMHACTERALHNDGPGDRPAGYPASRGRSASWRRRRAAQRRCRAPAQTRKPVREALGGCQPVSRLHVCGTVQGALSRGSVPPDTRHMPAPNAISLCGSISPRARPRAAARRRRAALAGAGRHRAGPEHAPNRGLRAAPAAPARAAAGRVGRLGGAGGRAPRAHVRRARPPEGPSLRAWPALGGPMRARLGRARLFLGGAESSLRLLHA